VHSLYGWYLPEQHRRDVSVKLLVLSSWHSECINGGDDVFKLSQWYILTVWRNCMHALSVWPVCQRFVHDVPIGLVFIKWRCELHSVSVWQIWRHNTDQQLQPVSDGHSEHIDWLELGV
jgi:hypothetical protein